MRLGRGSARTCSLRALSSLRNVALSSTAAASCSSVPAARLLAPSMSPRNRDSTESAQAGCCIDGCCRQCLLFMAVCGGAWHNLLTTSFQAQQRSVRQPHP